MMLEDYAVTVALPIRDDREFLLGTEPGYHPGDVPGDPGWFWDGHDIWLPPTNLTLFAALRGTLSFIPSGSNYVDAAESPSAFYGAVLPAIGDSLVLRVWPEDYVKLQSLLPIESWVPTLVVYQNVDQTTAAARAEALIVDDAERRAHYSKVFATSEDEGDITDEVFRDRVRHWIRTEWLNSRGMGILVDAGDEIATGAPVPTPPAGLPLDVRVAHGAPSGADESTWGRLTLKVVSALLHYDPAFFYYLVARAEDADWIERPRPTGTDERLVAQWIRRIEARTTTKVTHQLRDNWEYGDPPDPGMPAAQPSLVLRFEQASESRPSFALFDPHAGADALWRAQSRIETEASYEWTFDGAPLYAQRTPDWISWDPGFPFPEVGVRTGHWFPFAGRHRFILGLNMTTCRRKNGHDLAPNLFLPWDVWIEQPDNLAKLEADLGNIAAMGFSTVRVWAFEQMEGLDFAFEAAYASALREADATSPNPSFPLKRVEHRSRTFHACSDAEFHDMRTRSGWDLTVVPGPRVTMLRRNAVRVQRAAQAVGLHVLWTLWGHYGEGKFIEGIPGWNDFIQVASAVPHAVSEGRLPLQAWLYRALMTYPDFRASYLAHALRPLVRDLEAAGGHHVLGYEIMNEANLHWADSGLSHVLALGGQVRDGYSGRPISIDGQETGRNFRVMATHWTLNQTQIQSFVRACRDAIVDEAGEKIVLSGVSNSLLSARAMNLFYDPSDPHAQVDLSAGAVTRYATPPVWRKYTYSLAESGSQHLRRHHDRCLFLEAGESPSPSIDYDCARQVSLIGEVLRQCYRQGYAGVFLWQYDDPERGAGNTFRNQHAFTEYSPSPAPPHDHPTTVRFTGARPRPAADTVREFASSQRQFLLPLLTP